MQPSRHVLEALIHAHDDAVAAILAAPDVARDHRNPEVLAYLKLFHPDSPFTRGPLEQWQRAGDRGRSYRAASRHGMLHSTVQWVERRGASEVAVGVSTRRCMVLLDAAGEPVEAHRGVGRGEIIVRRYAERWLLDRLVEW